MNKKWWAGFQNQIYISVLEQAPFSLWRSLKDNMMRKQPLLIFLAISGFFYLTGRPIDDPVATTQSGNENLPPASMSVNSASPAGMAVPALEQGQDEQRQGEQGQGEQGVGVGKAMISASNNAASTAGGMAHVEKSTKSLAQAKRRAGKEAHAQKNPVPKGYDKAGGREVKTAALAIDEASPVKSPKTSMAASRTVSETDAGDNDEGRFSTSSLQREKTPYSAVSPADWASSKRKRANRSLDWSIFGNDRRARSGLGEDMLRKRMHLQRREERKRLAALVRDEDLALGNERSKAAGGNRHISRFTRKKSSRRKSSVRRKSTKRRRASRSRRSWRRSRRQRVARYSKRRSVRRRHKGRKIYRVARKHRKRKAKKKWYASLFKPQRRGRFGFVTHGAVTSLINN
jgi:hypothetical protein